MDDQLHQVFKREALPHLGAAYNFAFRMCGDRNHAADLVQEAYLKAIRSFSTFTPGSNCRAWLFQIIKNSYINEVRRGRFSGSLSPEILDRSEAADPFDFLPDSPTPEEDHNNLLSDEVAEELEKLPDVYRTIVILSDIEDYKYEEIAAFINRPVGTVRSRLHRARKLLAKNLTPYARKLGYAAV